MPDLWDPLTYENLMAGTVAHFEEQEQRPLDDIAGIDGPGIYALYYLNYALRVQLRRAEPRGTIGRPPKTWGKKVGWQRFQLRQPTPRRSPKWLPIENSIAPQGPSNKARG